MFVARIALLVDPADPDKRAQLWLGLFQANQSSCIVKVKLFTISQQGSQEANELFQG